MEIFVSLIIIIFGVLQIILFFKLWGMTNDVKRLTKHLCSIKEEQQVKIEESHIEEIEKYDPRLDTIKPGDKVESLLTGKVLIVDFINGNSFFCKTGAFSGYKYFKKSEVKYIEGSH